jgi:hypothetical protein
MHPLAEWEQANPGTVHDPEWFGRDVLPRLASVKLSEIVEAAGLLEGVRVGHQAWKVDASCFDVAGAGRGLGAAGRLVGNVGDTVSILSLVALPIMIVWRILPETRGIDLTHSGPS